MFFDLFRLCTPLCIIGYFGELPCAYAELQSCTDVAGFPSLFCSQAAIHSAEINMTVVDPREIYRFYSYFYYKSMV